MYTTPPYPHFLFFSKPSPLRRWQLVPSFLPTHLDSSIDHLHNALDRISSWMTENLLTLKSSQQDWISAHWLRPMSRNSVLPTTCQNQQLLTHYHSLCSKPRLHIWWTTHFFWPDLICLQILQLPYPSASLYPSIPLYQNSCHHRHFYCSLQARLLQLSLSQPAKVSDYPAPTDPELSCTCCCQSS